MAAEAQAEGPALAAAPPPPPAPAHGASAAAPEKRGLPIPEDDGGGAAEEEERRLPEPKRRRASVAALDGVPSASAVPPVAENAEGAPGSRCDGDGACFSFQHARGGFVALETTPKFGSFNPPGEAELAGLDLKPAEPLAYAEGSPEAGDEVPAAASAREAEVDDENSQLVGGEVDGQAQT